MENTTKLPWLPGKPPLMLAPMQGLTNRALRGLFVEWVRPDVVFTEFVRVKAGARKNISANDRREISAAEAGAPLVVQLIGADTAALLTAARTAQELGVRHLNLNLGERYRLLFHGDQQVLVKLKEVLCQVRDPDLLPLARELKRSKGLSDLLRILEFTE